MAAKQLINGKVYDWSSIDIGVDECENIEITSISYSDALEREAVYGKGGKVRGYGNGNYSGSVDITMLREDFKEFCKYIKNKNKKFYNYTIPKITVSYADEGVETTTDTITKVVISGRDFKSAQGDKKNEVTLKGMVAGSITTDGLEAL